MAGKGWVVAGRLGVSAILICVSFGGFWAGHAAALPAERHYEMVSPPYKGGYGVTRIGAVATVGDSVAYVAPGTFGGAPSGFNILADYLARRNPEGWLSVPMMAPTPLLPNLVSVDLSSSLSTMLETGKAGVNSQNADHAESLYLHNTEDPDVPNDWELIGNLVPVEADREEKIEASYEASSASFCHVFITTPTNEAFLPFVYSEDKNGSYMPYDYARGCDGDAKGVTAVGVNNRDKVLDPNCSTSLGDGRYSSVGNVGFDPVSLNGEMVYFTSCVSGEETSARAPHQLFVRLGEEKTIEVSRSLESSCMGPGGVVGEVPCSDAAARPNADFVGASEDGSLVYFITSASLVKSDEDTTEQLYLAHVGCPSGSAECRVGEREVTSLVAVSADGNPAEVQGVVRMAPDGSRVYYVAKGDLLTGAQQAQLEKEGKPTPLPGAENLYLYDEHAETTTFIADLCSEYRLSGSVEDLACASRSGSDSALWSMGNQIVMAQTAGQDGRFLVFASYAQLAQDDTNESLDVYRYDAETGKLLRVSVGEDGYDANGNARVLSEGGNPLGSEIEPEQVEGTQVSRFNMIYRAVSEDGSRVVFLSAAPLSPLADNGLSNAYEWHEEPGGGGGSVSLISSGASTQPTGDVTISPDGSDVFFVASDSLIPSDTDSFTDLYDARLGPGFGGGPPAGARPCEGDGCQGALSAPAPALVPGSAVEIPEGNAMPARKMSKAKPKAKAKHKLKPMHRRKNHRVESRVKRVSSGKRRAAHRGIR